MFDANLRAELVWDGTDEVRVPSTMEAPGPGQMVGTPHERLGEVSCRICYDSMGVDPITGKPKGRTSKKLHEHIKEVKNHSVYEHCTFTVAISQINVNLLALALINRPGVWFQWAGEREAEITLNHRCVLEWDAWSDNFPQTKFAEVVGDALHNYASILAPALYEDRKDPGTPLVISGFDIQEKKEGLTPEQAWVSLYMSGSRGWSHENVRHGDWTAISQRSSRFCNEADSPYVMHPLVSHFIADPEVGRFEKQNITHWTTVSQATDQKCYLTVVEALQEYLKKRGVEGTNARKQARGAARGYLGNALFTDMVFSASCRQWRWILSQRASAPADAEIRNIYAPHVLKALQSSQYGHMFDDMQLAPAPDGIGQIVVPTP